MFNRVAAIYDIHGNATALQAVLSEVQKCNVDAIVVGGDLVWGPQPALVIERLLSLSGKVYFIRGNTDRYVAGRYGIEQGLDDRSEKMSQWCAEQLSDQQIAFLQNLQENITLNIAGLGEVMFVHGSPRSDVEGIREDAPESEIAAMVSSVRQEIIVCGHNSDCLL
jgi:predicted phosphodiesterase